MTLDELPLSKHIALYNNCAVAVPHEILSTWVGEAARMEARIAELERAHCENGGESVSLNELPVSERTCSNCESHSCHGLLIAFSGNKQAKDCAWWNESGASLRARARNLVAGLEARTTEAERERDDALQVHVDRRYRCPDCNGQRVCPSNGVAMWCTLCGGTGAVSFDPRLDK